MAGANLAVDHVCQVKLAARGSRSPRARDQGQAPAIRSRDATAVAIWDTSRLSGGRSPRGRSTRAVVGVEMVTARLPSCEARPWDDVGGIWRCAAMSGSGIVRFCGGGRRTRQLAAGVQTSVQEQERCPRKRRDRPEFICIAGIPALACVSSLADVGDIFVAITPSCRDDTLPTTTRRSFRDSAEC